MFCVGFVIKWKNNLFSEVLNARLNKKGRSTTVSIAVSKTVDMGSIPVAPAIKARLTWPFLYD